MAAVLEADLGIQSSVSEKCLASVSPVSQRYWALRKNVGLVSHEHAEGVEFSNPLQATSSIKFPAFAEL